MRTRGLYLFRRYQIPAFIILFLICAFLLISLRVKEDSGVTFVDTLFFELTAPLQGATTSIVHGVQGVFQRYVFLTQVQKENRILRMRIAELEEGLQQGKEAASAENRLRNLLQFREKMPNLTVAAEVVGQDPSSWFRSVTINKGVRDGIRKGMAVISPEGVIGQVASATPHFATVLLITDYNSAIDAIVQRTRAKTIVEGRQENQCQLKYLLRTEDVTVGDTVVTSGLGRKFPKGLMVGQISKIDKKGYGVFQYAELIPSVDFTKLEEVLVVMEIIPPPQEEKEKKTSKSPSGIQKKK